MFYNTYQQAAAEGYLGFRLLRRRRARLNAPATSGLITAWPAWALRGGANRLTTSPSAVPTSRMCTTRSTGQNGGLPLSTYWSATNSASYGSAQSYIPEIPWNDSCAQHAHLRVHSGKFPNLRQRPSLQHQPRTTPLLATSALAAAGAGASNCATGAARRVIETNYGIITSECQGYAQTVAGSRARRWSGGKAVYGSNSDGVRDIPDVSLFAANGVWGHFETVCWADPAYTSDGAAICTGAARAPGPALAELPWLLPPWQASRLLSIRRRAPTGATHPYYYQIGAKPIRHGWWDLPAAAPATRAPAREAPAPLTT